jgi:hypothetical protein
MSKVVRAAIHPAIGFARVGDSRDEFYWAPEVDEPKPEESYKDATGALKREAARFRVYGYDADGAVVAELTAADADIEWTVHVANLKAAWYQFQLALDVEEARSPKLPPTRRRNAGVAREDLSIAPAPVTVSGADSPAASLDGTFMGVDVYLGEARTDPDGRLVFLGGHGVSASLDGKPPQDFANNDGWYDDVCDGPITATVRIGGEEVPVDPAWVVVGPPNYAPQVLTVRTLYDLLLDLNIQAGKLPKPERVSFVDDVLPILTRMRGLQWVNHGFATRFGFRGREDFEDEGYLRRLASKRPEHEELRQQIYNAFRDYERDGYSPNPWPWIYGDAMGAGGQTVRQHLELSPTQMGVLTRWKEGEFESDLDRIGTRGPESLDDVPLAEQPATLDRAALKYCLADAFHPGCELTWPIRHLSMYAAPFRLLHRPADQPEPDYGDVLTPDRALGADGPLHGQFPGSITRWMAIPWQTDTASCRNGYETQSIDPDYDPYLPTFWPARVPNEVLAEVDYDVVVDVGQPMEDREAAFEKRRTWLRGLTGDDYDEEVASMVTEWSRLGVVQARPGPSDGAFPGPLYVESEIGFDPEVNARRNLHALHVPEARDPEHGAEAVASARAEAAERLGVDPEEISAGFHTNIARFED